MKKKLSIKELYALMPHYPILTWGPGPKPSKVLSKEERIDMLEKIKKIWELNKDQITFQITRPKKLTGKKSKRLVCEVAYNQKLPWSTCYNKKGTKGAILFKNFRKTINSYLESEPAHKIDHIDFIF